MSGTSTLVGQTLGSYRVLRLIGVGGMGQVYCAKDARLNREVAIKVIHPTDSANPDVLRRFEQEAHALAALNHPNLLAIYDIGIHDGLPFIVSELLVGETLRTRINREPLTYHRALDFAVQILTGLVAAHEKGIIHRDLKPENIFLTTDGRVKILDFGLVKLVQSKTPGESNMDDTQTALRTDDGKVMGTVAYMSPEQIRGLYVDYRCDIFSVGAILFEMLTQTRAFRGETNADVITAILKEEPESLSDLNRQIPPSVSLIVQHCIEKRREDRFQSAKDLLFDLELLRTNVRSSGSTVTASESTWSNRKSATRVFAASLAIVAVIGVVAWLFQHAQADLPSFTQLTFRRGNISSARFTSDGNIVLYSAYWNGAPVDTFFIRTGTTDSRPLGLNNADLLSVSVNGELAILIRKKDALAWFGRGTLARVPMTGGTPREIVEDVQAADWSPSGSDLAISRQVSDTQQLEYPIGKVLYHTIGWITDIRVSPDGSRIAFLEHKYQSDDRGWVSLVDLNGNARRLTEEFASERGLAWSPRGDEIWFTATRSGEAFELFSVSLHNNLRTLTRVPTSLILHDISHEGTVLLSSSKTLTPIVSLPPGEKVERDISSLDQIGLTDLSADGKTYLFQYYGEGSGPSYSSYLGGTDGSPPVRLGAGSALKLSPDGRWAVAFDDQLRKTILQPVGAGDIRILQRPGFNETVNDDTWSPDARHIVFTGQEAGNPARSYIQDIDGGPPIPLGPEGLTNPILSPDGKRYLARRGESYVILGSNGEEPHETSGFELGDRVIRWSGDSRHLYVYRVDGSIQLFEVDPATGSRRLLREIPLLERDGLVGVPRLFVSADGKSYVYSFSRKFSELYLAKGIVH